MSTSVGKPINRVDGYLKVTGGAKYSADFNLPQLAHAVIIQSSIASGRIHTIDTQAALLAPGVLAIITHLNAPKLNSVPDDLKPVQGKIGQQLLPLQDEIIYYNGQHIGVVIATTLGQATYAASLVRVEYELDNPIIDMMSLLSKAYPPKDPLGLGKDAVRGDIISGLADADVCIECCYTTPIEHHNPMELSATVANWNGDKVTLYDATQGINSTSTIVSLVLGIPKQNVRVLSYFVGGGFGCKGFTWSHTILAAIASRFVNRPVKLVVTRQQMFTSVGYRPKTLQNVTLGAIQEGILTVIRHHTINSTPLYEDFAEPCGSITKMLYECPNVEVTHRVVQVNLGTPTIMRAPGEASGTFALESAIDELAYALNLDPLELRLRNYAEKDPQKNLPWSSKSLYKCYQEGAERFGWSQRNPEVGSMRNFDLLVGWGMATAAYPVYNRPTAATVQILASGQARAISGTQDIGTGTYTVMTQIAADALGISVEQVHFELGDTQLPRASSSGGSSTAASVGSAVHLAAQQARDKLIAMAITDTASPLHSLDKTQVKVKDGYCYAEAQPQRGETYADILKRHHMDFVEATSELEANTQKQYSMYAFGAHFAEVQVNPRTRTVRVTRFTSGFGAGRILNPKTARSQVIGGITFGISMALQENSVVDEHSGRFITASLADYHVPVHADTPAIETFFVEEQDTHINPIGVKGVGEIGIVGSAAAVANAIYHATGKRIRDLPITVDKLM